MNATPRNVVNGSQPDPLFVAYIDAEAEAADALESLEQARKQLNAATLHHRQAVGRRAIAQCWWTLGARP